MKIELLKIIRGDIRITPYSHGFYDLEMYHNFKWQREGSHHFMWDLLKLEHYIMKYRLIQYKKFPHMIKFKWHIKKNFLK